MKFKEIVIHTYLDTENYKQWFAMVTADLFQSIQLSSISLLKHFGSGLTDHGPAMRTRHKSSRPRRDRDAHLPRPRRWLHQPGRDVYSSRDKLY